jgi:hypothetical protein
MYPKHNKKKLKIEKKKKIILKGTVIVFKIAFIQAHLKV